jgi:hypothetical protein
VVIGILLVLQFNAWNQEKENTQKEKWYLNNIVENLEYQKTILKEMILYWKESISIEKSLIKDFSLNYSFSYISSLHDKFLNVKIIYYYLFYEANDNDLNSIFYKKKYHVLNTYSQVNRCEKSSSSNEASLDSIDKALTLFTQNKLKEPAFKLELINAVKTKLILLENFLDLVHKTLIDIDSLIKKIDTYLGYTPDMVTN